MFHEEGNSFNLFVRAKGNQRCFFFPNVNSNVKTPQDTFKNTLSSVDITTLWATIRCCTHYSKQMLFCLCILAETGGYVM